MGDVLRALDGHARRYPVQNTGIDDVSTLLAPEQLEFIDYLLDPSTDKGTQLEFAEAHGVRAQRLTEWKKHPIFKRVWRERGEALYGDADHVNNVRQALYLRAIEGDVAAIKVYMQYMAPSAPKPKEETKVSRDMTDEELAVALEATITQLRSKGA